MKREVAAERQVIFVEYVRFDRATAILTQSRKCGLSVHFSRSSPAGADADHFGFSMDAKETHGAVSRSVPARKRDVRELSTNTRQAKILQGGKNSGS